MTTTANFTCGIYPVNIAGPPCSGNGACVFSAVHNRGVCQCLPGWHGESDIQVTTSLSDCHVHRDGLLALWAIYLAAQIVFGIMFVPKLRWLLARHVEQRRKAKEKNRTYAYFDNKPLLAWMPYFCLGYPAQLVYALGEIGSLAEMNLGRDVLLTACYIIWRFTFYFALFVFQANFLASLLKAERSLDGVIRKNFIMSYAVLFCICAVSVCIIIPHIAVAQPGYDEFDPYLANVAIFFGACSLCFLFVVGQSMYIKRKVITILDRTHNMTSADAKSKRLRAKIIRFQELSRNTALVQFLIYGTFCAFPYLWNKHDWLMPFSWLAVLRTMLEGLNSLVDTEKDRELTADSNGPKSDQAASNGGGGAGWRKRSSLLDAIMVRVRAPSILGGSGGGGGQFATASGASPKPATTATLAPIAAVSAHDEVGADFLAAQEKPLFEHSMKRASVGGQHVEVDSVPDWALNQESVSRDLVTGNHHA